MFVTGSVQVDVELVEEVVEVVVVQVIAVLAAAWWQDGRLRSAMKSVNKRRRFIAPLSSIFEIPNAYGSVSTMILKIRNSISLPALDLCFKRLWPRHPSSSVGLLQTLKLQGLKACSPGA
jgi:hypothetical protein